MTVSDRPMAGKTCIVTGATGGIGRITAAALAAKGARVIAVGRNRSAGERLVAEIRGGFGEAAAEFLSADLSSQAEIRNLATTVRDMAPRLDVLLNNAGGMFGRRSLSADGIEMTFALNHLAYVLLTRELLPVLRAAAPARVVNVASSAHRGVALDFDDLQCQRRYRGFLTYKKSKLANLYFTYALARRTQDDGVNVNALHPGFVATDIGTRNRWVSGPLWRLLCLGAIPVERGAETSIHLASSPQVDGVSGMYFAKCRPVRSSDVSYDEEAAERLWAVSETLLNG